MQKRRSEYESLLNDIIEMLKKSPKEIENIVQVSEKVADAASDMTKDELSLISAYVQADLKEFADSYEESKSGPFYLMIKNSIWEGLASITDNTRLEWQELFSELENQGVYEAGDLIALGVLKCEKCGHQMEYNHPTEIIPCTACGHRFFSRI